MTDAPTPAADGRAAPRRRPLTVFAPIVHGALATGLAASFARVGMRMMVSGPTMTTRLPASLAMTAAECHAAYGPHVSAYEGDDILTDPPDVMMVGNPDNEPGQFALTRTLREKGPVALVAYSGVFQSRYNYPLYHGVVANDVPSRVIARYHGVPALKYFPDMDFTAYPFRREPDTERVILRSFVNDFEKRFPLSAQFFTACRDVCAATFGDRVLVENVSRQARPVARRRMIEMTASLHVKDSEGYGYAVLEGMSLGRPLITQRGLSRNMAYTEWAVEGRSHFPIDAPEDIVPLVRRLIDDPVWRFRIQKAASQDVRTLNFQREAEKLADFLDALVLLARARWGVPRTGQPQPIGPFVATLDPAAMQPFETVALGGRRASTLEELDP